VGFEDFERRYEWARDGEDRERQDKAIWEGV